MLQKSYTRNYLNIYLFQTLSIVLGFVSLFVVIPYLSGNKEIYGIYSICISVTVFFSYADLGFLSAGTKYAAECYTRNEEQNELKYLGFSHFILFICMLLFSVLFILVGFNPEWLVKGLDSMEKYETAQRLFFILAVFAPTTVLQRLPQMILSIRVKQHLYQQIQIVGNLIKIASVFYFFTGGRYNIVGYFFMLQLITLLCSLITCVKIKRVFHYDFKGFWTYFRFSKAVFQNTYVLALSSLVVTVCWVLYYELDSMAIGKILGAEEVAVYAIGFTILNFFRSLLGVLFSPFNTRFNHFYGLGNIEELKHFYRNIILMTFPLIVFPILALTYATKPFILSWVGSSYESSVQITQWLILCNILAFVAYPAGILLYALEKIKVMYWVNIISVILFWLGIALTINRWGTESFAIFKFLTFLLSGVIYIKISSNFLQKSLVQFMKEIILPYLPALFLLCIVLFFSHAFFMEEKSWFALFVNIGIIIINMGIVMIFSVLMIPQLKSYLLKLKHEF